MATDDFKNVSSVVLETITGSNTKPSILSGLINIDNALHGWHDSELIIIGGRPAMGKTAFAIKVARNAADQGFPVLFRSIEMSRQQIVFRIIADIVKIDSRNFIAGKITPEDRESIIDACGTLDKLPLFINDKPHETIEDLKNSIVSFHEKHGHCLIVIDNLQYIEGVESERKDIEIGTITRGLKLIANELCIPIVVTSHLNRKLLERSDKRPQISDLRGSGEIEQDADVICFLYRDEVYNREECNPNKGVAEFLIEKNRSGITGFVPLRFLPQTATFEDYCD